MATVA
jgi:hypothetical protein